MMLLPSNRENQRLKAELAETREKLADANKTIRTATDNTARTARKTVTLEQQLTAARAENKRLRGQNVETVALRAQLKREKATNAALNEIRCELQQQNDALSRDAVDRSGILAKPHPEPGVLA